MVDNPCFFNDFRKNQRNTTKILSRRCNSLIKTANYEEARVKLKNAKLNKLKSAAKSRTGITLRIAKKKTFKDEELFLTARQKTKIRNAFANNMSTDINLSKAHCLK